MFRGHGPGRGRLVFRGRGGEAHLRPLGCFATMITVTVIVIIIIIIIIIIIMIMIMIMIIMCLCRAGRRS